MDRLTAFVTLAHARLRLEIIAKYKLLETDSMATPKLQGLAEAMKKLEHDLEDGAGKLMVKVEALGPRGQAALAKGDQRIEAKAKLVGEIESFVTALEGANGGDPLDDSSDLSVKPPAMPEPPLDQTLTIGLPTDKPENLTVNGVLKHP